MALHTLGTAATTTLNAFLVGSNDLIPADVASIKNVIQDDSVNNPPGLLIPGAYEQTGRLYVPRRGYLIAFPGDYIGYDASGWPILLSARAAANANWVHT
jgi:hypothetical protein